MHKTDIANKHLIQENRNHLEIKMLIVPSAFSYVYISYLSNQCTRNNTFGFIMYCSTIFFYFVLFIIGINKNIY